MDISRARQTNEIVYTIGGEQLQFVNTERLLGVNISRDLRWNNHTAISRNKAAQTLSFVARNLQGCTPRVKRVAYLTLVKPGLFYGTPAWHPTTKVNVESMERVQKRALRFIYGKHTPEPAKHKIMPVPMQLRYNDLALFKKCETGVTDFDARARITQGRALRGDDARHPRLLQPPARSDLGRSAYSYRVVKPWNDLPAALKECGPDQFPALCKAHLWQSFSV